MAASRKPSPSKEDREYILTAVVFGVLVVSVIAYGWTALYWAIPIAALAVLLRLWRSRRKKGRNPS